MKKLLTFRVFSFARSTWRIHNANLTNTAMWSTSAPTKRLPTSSSSSFFASVDSQPDFNFDFLTKLTKCFELNLGTMSIFGKMANQPLRLSTHRDPFTPPPFCGVFTQLTPKLHFKLLICIFWLRSCVCCLLNPD